MTPARGLGAWGSPGSSAKAARDAKAPARKPAAKAPAKADAPAKAPARKAAPAKAKPAKADPEPAPAACRDFRCTDGLTACRGCRAHGVLKANGKHYRYRTPAENISPNAVKHADCKGSGKAVCGCQPVTQATARKVGKQQTAEQLAA